MLPQKNNSQRCGLLDGKRSELMSEIGQITTAEQLLHASDLGRCELLRGELVMMSPSGFEHGRLVTSVSTPLDIFVSGKGLGVVLARKPAFGLRAIPTRCGPQTWPLCDPSGCRLRRSVGSFRVPPTWPLKFSRLTTAPAKCWPKCRTGWKGAAGASGSSTRAREASPCTVA